MQKQHTHFRPQIRIPHWVYAYIELLMSVGLRGGQHINKLLFVEICVIPFMVLGPLKRLCQAI